VIQQQYPLESLFERMLSPFERFLRRTTAGGIILMTTTVMVLALATAFDVETIDTFWERSFALEFGNGIELNMPLRHWVNDGLMALFFLLVGLELKREILVGELSSLKDAALPVIAALGGMILPALVFAAFNRDTPTASGWGIPMATDIAFAVGILVLLAWRVPKNLIIFLTALAIADDLGAVMVIALFYTTHIDLQSLGVAAVLLCCLLLFNRGGIRNRIPYIVVGFALWSALHASGIHATLAGILLAATIPARPTFTPMQFETRIQELLSGFRTESHDNATPDDPLSNDRMASIAEAMERSAAAVQSPLQRIEHDLTPLVTFVVIPIFALANAGLDLAAVAWNTTFTNPLTVGVLAGLVIGKCLGVGLFSWIAVRTGIARLPPNVNWSHIFGAAWLAGIGFTMSLFIAQLAFKDPQLVEQAKIGILLGSSISAATGLVWLWWSGSSAKRRPEAA